MDRIDSAYYAHSTRIDINDETRINATNDEAESWRKENEATTGKLNPASGIRFILTWRQHHRTLSLTFSISLSLQTTLDSRRSWTMWRTLADSMMTSDGIWKC